MDVGAITVNDPFDKLNATPAPPGSEAAAFPRDNWEVPEDAPALMLNTILAIVPFGISVWSRPKMITRTVPAAGREYDSILDAGTAEPLETLLTDRRLLSKVRSKFNPVTWVPAPEFKVTGMEMPVSPAIPEPLPDANAAGD